jgi:glycine hydroxymethyltransferase
MGHHYHPQDAGRSPQHVIAGKAVCFLLAATDEFKQKQIETVQNAKILADTLMEGGLKLVSGGTDNHLLLVDFSGTEMTGMLAQELLDRVGITANRNGVPFDERPPTVASGLRLGTPAMTTRGFGPEEMREVGWIIVAALTSARLDADFDGLLARGRALTAAFPLYSCLGG